MRKLIAAIVTMATLSGMASMPAHADSTNWVTLKGHKQLHAYLTKHLAGEYYPTSVQCRVYQGKFQFKMTLARVGPDKPYHKWNATFAEPGASIQAAVAKLPITGHEHLRYRIVQQCSAGGIAFAVAFRGDRKQD